MTNNSPLVYRAVRSIGVLKPRIQPQQGRVFADSLDVRGTAFWLKEQKVLITCAHVVDNLLGAPLEVSGLLVVGNKGEYIRATMGVIDFEHDLALLELPLDTPSEVMERESQSGLGLADQYPDVGKGVGYAGFPLGLQLLNSTQEPSYAEGVVSAQIRHKPNRKEIQISGTVIGGYSGAPIVSLENPDKIIGILSNSPSKEAGSAGIFMAVSFEHIRALALLARS